METKNDSLIMTGKPPISLLHPCLGKIKNFTRPASASVQCTSINIDALALHRDCCLLLLKRARLKINFQITMYQLFFFSLCKLFEFWKNLHSMLSHKNFTLPSSANKNLHQLQAQICILFHP